MLLTCIILFFLVLSGSIHGYDADPALVHCLVPNNLTIVGTNSNDTKVLNSCPEDCAAIYINKKARNQHVRSGIYKIWPRESIIIGMMLF